MKMMNSTREFPIEWLLEGEPYIQYRTRRDLLRQPEFAPEVETARRAMLSSPPVQALVAGLSDWPGTVIASHKSASQPFHRLTFLADLGLTASDPGVETVIARILAHQSDEGPFQLPMNISASYGGTGQEQSAWALCDAPLILYALARFGMQDEPAVQKAAEYLAGLVRENGWPCAVSKELGSFRVGQAAETIPAHLPTWQCSRHYPPLIHFLIARPAMLAQSRCLPCGIKVVSATRICFSWVPIFAS
jgi:hypothetical protein